MRNAILTLFSAFLVLIGASASAQIITSSATNRDTAWGQYTGGDDLSVHNNIRSASANPVFLKWNVFDHNLGTVPGWDLQGSGVCDNVICYSAVTPTNNLFTNGTMHKSDAYGSNFGDFHVVFKTDNPANGTSAFVRIAARDTIS